MKIRQLADDRIMTPLRGFRAIVASFSIIILTFQVLKSNP